MPTAVRAKPRIHGGNPWPLLRAHGLSQDQLLDFSLDVNPFGFPELVRTAVLAHLDDLRQYPDPEAVALREAIAASHGVAPDAILPGNGSAELIGLIARLRPMGRVLVPVPTFTEYAWAAEQAGAVVVAHPLDERRGFRLDGSGTEWASLLRDVDALFLCNPNNPTGVALPRDEVIRLADQCRDAGCLLVIDEAYVEFTDRPMDVTVLPEAAALDHVIVLRSLTKWFAIPGLRLGYLAAAPPLVETLRAMQQPWPLNTFSLAVGTALVRHADDGSRPRRLLGELRREFHQALASLPGLMPCPTSVNFVLCKLDADRPTAAELAQRLAAERILIRPCDDFVGLEPGRFIRLAVRTREDNVRVCARLREALRHDR